MTSRRPLSLLLAMLLAILSLACCAAAAGPQGYPIAGTVVDSITSQPLPDISVSLTSDKPGSSSLTAVSSANGRFSFASIAAGKYILGGSGPGYRAQGLNQHGNYFTGIAVGPELDATNIVFRLRHDASIRGQVVDDQNEPVRNATAQLFRVDDSTGLRRTVSETNAGTNDQGVYHFPHLAPGTYYVAVSGRPWYAQYVPRSQSRSRDNLDPGAAALAQQEASELDVAYPLTFYPDADDSAQASAITLHAGDRVSADITMRAVPAAHLRVHGEGPSSGAPPSLMQRVFDGLLIPVLSSQGYGFNQGVFEFSGLAPGHYVLQFQGDSTRAGRSGGWSRDIDLYGDVDISAADSTPMATVTGMVVYEGGAAPNDGYFELRGRNLGDIWHSQVWEKGLFGLRDNEVRPDTYDAVLEEPPGWLITKIIAQNAKVQGTEITLAAGASARLVCTATRVSAQVTGTVLQGDKPLGGAMVLMVPDDALPDKQRYRRDESDSDGTFTLREVLPGHYTVVALENGWNIEWGNPDVLRPYLANGEKVIVTAEKNTSVKLQAQ